LDRDSFANLQTNRKRRELSMSKQSSQHDLIGVSSAEAYLSGLLEVIDLTVTTGLRRGFESVDANNEDARLEVMLRYYRFTTMLIAEEAHACGILDPLSVLEAQTGILREASPELQSEPVPESTESGKRQQ
jgi:hypothetical protein